MKHASSRPGWSAPLKEPRFYGDGGGLYLQVSEYATKSWVFRFIGTEDPRYGSWFDTYLHIERSA